MNTMDRSLEQRRDALVKANKIRVYRAQLKKDVAAGREPYDAFLTRGAHDPRLQSMKLKDALAVMPVIGPVKVNQILTRAGISPSKTLGGLSPVAWERLYLVLESYPTIQRRLSERRATVSP